MDVSRVLLQHTTALFKSGVENTNVLLISTGHLSHEKVSKYSLKKFYMDTSIPYLRRCSLLPEMFIIFAAREEKIKPTQAKLLSSHR